jgi:hypothetical protein
MAFDPVTAPFAAAALKTVPSVTHDIFQATSGKVDSATQATMIANDVKRTAQAIDSVSTGGQKKTLDAITQPLQEGGPSLLDAGISRVMDIVQAAITAPPA